MDQEFEFNISALASSLLKKIWMSVVLALVMGGIFLAYTAGFITPTYTSSAVIYVINSQQGGISLSDLQGSDSLSRDIMLFAERDVVLDKVIEKSGMELTSKQLRAMISVSNPTDTRFISISVTHPDPGIAKRIVDLVCNETKEGFADVVHSEQIEIIEYGNLPETPSAPSLKRNTFYGAVLGFIIPIIINAFLFIINDKLITVEDVESRLGINVIGRVPYSSKLNEKHI